MRETRHPSVTSAQTTAIVAVLTAFYLTAALKHFAAFEDGGGPLFIAHLLAVGIVCLWLYARADIAKASAAGVSLGRWEAVSRNIIMLIFLPVLLGIASPFWLVLFPTGLLVFFGAYYLIMLYRERSRESRP